MTDEGRRKRQEETQRDSLPCNGSVMSLRALSFLSSCRTRHVLCFRTDGSRHFFFFFGGQEGQREGAVNK